jgi:polysaccharide deacetylase family sporulation protein PdaB
MYRHMPHIFIPSRRAAGNEGESGVKIVFFDRRTVIYAAAVAVLAAALAAVLVMMVPKAVSAAAVKRDLPIYGVERRDRAVSLTFDAAWGNEDTQTLIDILNKHGVKATFFIVGQWADKYPESVKALADNGEEVMNHSDKHPHMPKLGREAMLGEINSCDEKIMKLTGKKPALFRAPYGDYDNSVIAAARDSGHFCIQWSVDSLDWRGITADKITARVLSKVKPGDIILFHNAALHTPEALPGIIESLQKQGYSIVPVSQLIYKDGYFIDSAGIQRPGASSSQPSAPSGQSEPASSPKSSGSAPGQPQKSAPSRGVSSGSKA